MENHEMLRDAVLASPHDRTAKLVYADALDEAGERDGADKMRREVAEADALETEALAVKDRIIAAGISRHQIYTLREAVNGKGYWANRAYTYLAAGQYTVFVYGETAITKTPFRKSAHGGIIYYRKAYGGKWVRSAQADTVVLK